MSAHHQAAPNAADHNSDDDVTALIQLTADEAIVAEILGHDVHDGHARLSPHDEARISQLLHWHAAAHTPQRQETGP